MMSIGQSRAQMVHLMQRSSSRRNMPRNRCAGSQRSSGYCTVTFFLNMFLPVIPSPANRSRSMILSRNRFSALIGISGGGSDPKLDRRGQDQVEQSERDQPLPTQVHELIEPVARKGAAEPDIGEQEEG